MSAKRYFFQLFQKSIAISCFLFTIFSLKISIAYAESGLHCSSLLSTVNSEPLSVKTYNSPKEELLDSSPLNEASVKRIKMWILTDPDFKSFLEEHLNMALKHSDYAERSSQQTALRVLGPTKSPADYFKHIEFMIQYAAQTRKKVFDLAAIQLDLLSHFMFDPSLKDWLSQWYSAQSLFFGVDANPGADQRYQEISRIFKDLIIFTRENKISSLRELYNNEEAIKPLSDFVKKINSEDLYLLNEDALNPK